MIDAGHSSSAGPLRIVFFGDSVCVGQGISIHRSWVSRLSARLDELDQDGKPHLVVVNASVNGNTTRQALERMPYEIQSQGVALLLMQFGMNDCNFWLSDRGLARVSPKSFAANLEEIIERGFKFGASRIFVNTNHPTTRDRELMPHTKTTYEANNRRYNQLIRDVVGGLDERVVLNDIERSFLEQTGGDRSRLMELLLDDELHLSVKGHDVYYDVIANRVISAVRSLLLPAGVPLDA